MSRAFKLKKRKHAKKKRKKLVRCVKSEPRFGFVQEGLLLLMIVCAVGSFLVEPPWSGILLLVVLLSAFLLCINAIFNKKLRFYLESKDSKIEQQVEESGWEAVQLMNGIKHKNHYEGLPEEVKKKSLFGKFE